MNAAQLIQSWQDDDADHGVVWARDWDPFCRGVRAQCEGCGRVVSVFPIVLETRAANPLLHILCREKCMAISLKICGPLKFGGRIEENVLPKDLQRFVR
jgi:hypothetical protein